MTDINTTFCRALLASIDKLVKQHAPQTNLRKSAWVYHFQRDQWEFHGPNKFIGMAAPATPTRPATRAG
jgi:hypothetical protein